MTTVLANNHHRTLIRVARQARDALQHLIGRRFRDIDSQATLLRDHLARVEDARRRLAICQGRGWLLAAEKIVDQIRVAARDVPYAVDLVERSIESRRTRMPKLGEIVAELTCP
ncbi:MAG: hypothetical protein NTV86_05065 [Planctomycetota bacterium]|nr:hypothetical protein [Planctomycetota bacterium]